MTHICVGNLTIIGSNNGLSPERRQAIIWPNAGILLIGPLWTNLKSEINEMKNENETLIKIYTSSLTKIHLKMSFGKRGHFVLASMCKDINCSLPMWMGYWVSLGLRFDVCYLYVQKATRNSFVDVINFIRFIVTCSINSMLYLVQYYTLYDLFLILLIVFTDTF